MTIQSIVTAQPAIFIVIASLVIALFISLVYKYATNQREMKRLRDELKHLQGRVKENKHNQEKILEIQKELAGKNLEYMKHSFRPMMLTFFPVIIIFWWLSSLYKDIGIVLTIPFIGLGLNWIWTYILFSFIFSLILRKALRVH